MKKGRKHNILDLSLILQCIVFVFTPLRIAIICTLLITCVLYRNIKMTMVRLMSLIIYCTVTFLLFSYSSFDFDFFTFLGVAFKDMKTDKDMFFHESKTLYFALLPNKSTESKIKAFEQAFSEENVETRKDCRLSSIVNLDDSKAYENTCIISSKAKLVYVNGKVIPYEQSKHNCFDKPMTELTKKSKLLKQIDNNFSEALLFSVQIPEFDHFWCEYKKLIQKEDMLRYIILKSGFDKKFANSKYVYAIFYTDSNLGIKKFSQKNIIKINLC